MPFYETTIIVRQDASTQQVEKLGEEYDLGGVQCCAEINHLRSEEFLMASIAVRNGPLELVFRRDVPVLSALVIVRAPTRGVAAMHRHGRHG